MPRLLDSIGLHLSSEPRQPGIGTLYQNGDGQVRGDMLATLARTHPPLTWVTTTGVLRGVLRADEEIERCCKQEEELTVCARGSQAVKRDPFCCWVEP